MSFFSRRRPAPYPEQEFRAILAQIGGLAYEVRQFRQVLMALQDDIDALTQSVAAETTANQSAIALINGFAAQLAAAVAAAQAAGATADQLAALEALKTSIDTNATDLAAAVTANTPTP